MNKKVDIDSELRSLSTVKSEPDDITSLRVKGKQLATVKSSKSEAAKLLNFFYREHPTTDLVRNYSRDLQAITKALEIATSDQVKLGIYYLHYQNSPSLQYLIDSINTALQIQEAKKQAGSPGTAAYLVHSYYLGFGLNLSSPNLVKEVRSVQLLITELGYEKTEALLLYMQKKRYPDLRMIKYAKNEFLIEDSIYITEDGELADLAEL